ncbi:phage holin family protein [Paenibacillus larvae]|jgi:toxin secretion/phage lysis holin|uniref:Toxin secretion/phage lysis holin n=4 Tax=Paenibacillus larvae TaxID=1464 RepID=V9W4K9_9BACL|nr:phage holin family protein [Paenibacillus larvae]AHD04570.1 toxin secretion/phage lysis holin [Paenibacillus larvae subsp. larvae DSM 25430]AQR78190.1 holin [Paenibacillus larvae subsp. larvae]AQT85794.1 holin [Paenibacillus larvae subsp. pulvifaciens]AQZ45983.1 holin [Paenibacillus larvae subsp. pulvifaciens]ARF69097.1 holin [Paenibacillus larvae subsp. pulvifaciens]
MSLFIFSSSTAVLGTIITYAFGGWSDLLSFFLLTIAIDYITGIAASIKEGKGLDSNTGYWGLARKGLILLVILLAHRLDLLMKTNVVMNASVFFYLANELISITENYGRLGLPMPDRLKQAIEVLKNKNQKP